MVLGASGTIIELTSKTLGKLAETRISIVDFWASWCVPCRKLAPIYEEACAEVSAKRPGQIGFFKVNVEQESSLANTYDVLSIPAVIAFSGGKPLDRFSGRPIKEDLIRWIEKIAGNGQG